MSFKLSGRAGEIDDEVFRIALGLPSDVLKLTAGEPDFPSSDFVNSAANASIGRGETHYTNPSGIPELREEIAGKLRKENDLSYSAEEIVVTPGSSPGIWLLMFALADRGDEILIPDPAWFHYSVLARLAGCVPKRLPLKKENGYRISAADIEELAGKKTKLMIINTPSNPTGRVMGREELSEIAAAAENSRMYVVSDEIYEKIVYPPHRHVSLASLPGMKERTIVVNGLSKGYAMMGWRIGFTASSAELASKLSSLLGYTMVCASSVSQNAAVEALRNRKSEEYARMMVEAWSRRRDLVIKAVKGSDGLIDMIPPDGAFYAWMNVSSSGMDGKTFASRLLKERKVGVLPGYLFGDTGRDFIRISFATSDEVVSEGMERIVDFIRSQSTAAKWAPSSTAGKAE
ncbi:MAG: pyridoxal phosphate-dependent aminotransferase [Thermoplasmata archaeon]|uniref:Aminotransferase n=1 Tax=Candidatus Sysuiplasma superficiale TaxID=2823368 RepID=A0A8J7YNF1_9ARCH|nr:pyridoxal phosphate-dependent aminotransferase [Candidatus Sysuiplasma superficiale]MCL4346292.1 pyridoxal phosphate-dependent aminotransferase [Candidatus Thermoplasmatota archaeon]